MTQVAHEGELRDSSLDRQFPQGTASNAYMLWLAAAYMGSNAVEVLSAIIIPISARLFTDNAIVISVIVSLNALFGFLAAPYVAWKSDRMQTRFGRRRPFMIAGFSMMLISVLGLMAMVQLITGDARHTLWALAIMILLNVLMQCFQDVAQGSFEPLMGDTFKQEKLGRALATRNYFAMIAGFSLSYWAIKKADTMPWLPYLVTSAWLTLSIAIIVFVVRERPMAQAAEPQRMYNPIRHLGLLFSNMAYLRVAVIAALGLVLPASFILYNSLYVTQQLGMKMSDLAAANLYTPFVIICCTFPVGYMIDRFGPKYSIAVGFAVLAVVSVAMAWHVRTPLALIIAMNFYALIPLLIYGAMTPMTFQFAPPKERGTVYGLVQFSRAFTRFISTLLLGFLVQFSLSWEPTPFYPADIRKSGDFLEKITNPADPVSKFISQRLSPDTRELLKDPKDSKGVKPQLVDSLATDLNTLITGPSIHSEAVFAEVELTRQSRQLLARQSLSTQDTLILNRSLIVDAYPGIISKKLNYRATYMANIVLGLLAMLLVLRTKSGPYARTVKDATTEAGA